MKKYLITASALALLIGGPALAAGDDAMKSSTDAQTTAPASSSGGNVSAAGTQQQSDEVDTDSLIGRDIENAGGEDIGEINSVILSQEGQVEAVIVGVGGFLGMGERDVAIQWDELDFGANNEQIVANTTREELEQLPEYQFADETQRGTAFQGDMANAPATQTDRVGTAAGTAAGTAGGMAAGTASGAAENSEREMSSATGGTDSAGTGSQSADTQNAQPVQNLSNMSTDEVIGQEVVNLRGEQIGEIEDVVLDENEAAFAVVSVGGFLGMGDKSVAVPIDELQLGQENMIMMSEATEEQLESMPAYEKTGYQSMERGQPMGQGQPDRSTGQSGTTQ